MLFTGAVKINWSVKYSPGAYSGNTFRFSINNELPVKMIRLVKFLYCHCVVVLLYISD